MKFWTGYIIGTIFTLMTIILVHQNNHDYQNAISNFEVATQEFKSLCENNGGVDKVETGKIRFTGDFIYDGEVICNNGAEFNPVIEKGE